MSKIIRFNDWPLLVKLLVVMILITAVPLATVGVFNAANTANVLDETIGSAFQEEAEDVSAQIASFFDEQTKILESLSTNSIIINSLQARNRSYQGSDEEILEQLLALDDVWQNGDESTPLIANTLSTDAGVNPVTPILLRFEDIFDGHIEVFVTDVQGATVGATNRLSDYYQADEEWWQVAFNEGEGSVFISDPIFDESANVTGVQIAVPIFTEGDRGEILGIARSNVSIESLEQELTEASLGQAGQAQLINKAGEVILDPNSNVSFQFSGEFLDRLKGQQMEHINAVDEAGDRSIFGSARLGFLRDQTVNRADLRPREIHIREALDRLGWFVVVREKEATALAPVAETTRLATITIIAAVLVAAVVAYALARILTRQINKIQALFGEVNAGNFDARVEVVSGDELGQLAINLNGVLDTLLALVQTQEERDALQASIRKLQDEVAGVAVGDLTIEADTAPGVTGPIAASFNLMIAELRNIISTVQESTLQVSASANQIQTTAEQLAEGSESQAGRIIDTSAAVDEMAVSIQQVSENAALSATVAEQSLVNARQGAEVVKNTIEGMNRIRTQVQETARRITRLGESTQQIGEIVQLIQDIADRTSILALNASIQADLAGEAGQGFAVVASEVETLAEQATEATRQISTLVRTIQSETTETVSAMDQSSREVQEGTQLADRADQALSEIEGVSSRLADLIKAISMASKQQARGSDSIARAMGEIAEVTQQTAVGTKQTAVSINNLAHLADDLRGSVSTFRLPANGRNGHQQQETIDEQSSLLDD